eukprot:9440203-Ditylum_brightwellii.AAC.1
MEAKYIALAHSVHELLPAKWLLEELSQQLELGRESLSTLSTVWEDNNGSLALANMIMPHMTPCSKHIGQINSKEQKWDTLAKPLGKLESLEKEKCSWD